MKELQGKLDASGIKVGIVISRFNDFINNKLLDGALDCLERHGCSTDDITLARVPGSFEIPLMAKKMCESKTFDTVICLGTVIRGATPHFDFVANEATKGIAQVMLEHGVPVSFGILTTDSIEQAIERAGTKAGNKGWDAALGAVEMVNLLKQL